MIIKREIEKSISMKNKGGGGWVGRILEIQTL